jgi:hypothetical protein
MRIAALSLLALLASTCHADTILPAAFANIRLLPGGTTFTTDGGFSSDGTPQTFSLSAFGGTVAATNQPGTDPQVSSSISFSGSTATQEQFEAISQVIYYVVANGPANQTATLTFVSNGQSTLSGSLNGGFSASSTLTVIDTQDSTTVISETANISSPATPPTASFSLDQTISVMTNVPYEVSIEANSQLIVNSSRSGTFMASASVDPTITLDTSDPAYSLEFSPGLITTPAPTPEPTSLTLLATGLAGVAAFGRRKLRRA